MTNLTLHIHDPLNHHTPQVMPSFPQRLPYAIDLIKVGRHNRYVITASLAPLALGPRVIEFDDASNDLFNFGLVVIGGAVGFLDLRALCVLSEVK